MPNLKQTFSTKASINPAGPQQQQSQQQGAQNQQQTNATTIAPAVPTGQSTIYNLGLYDL